MPSQYLTNCSVIAQDSSLRPECVGISNGVISSVGDAAAEKNAAIDLRGATLFPGFIDIHNHGAAGVDVNEADADSLLEVSRFLATRGVTSWLPTFVPDSFETYKRVIAAIDEVMARQTNLAVAQIVGVHYEGVFASKQMCGALRPEYFKTFSGVELAELPRLKGGAHLTTLAPEIDGGIELIKALVKENWIPSVGHTKADFATLQAAFDAGARHVTHLFNAMTGIHHRDVGVAGWALTNDDVSCEIIADCIHVHPEMLKFAANSKPSDKLILVSDSVAPTGLGDGEFELWGETISVRDGRTQNERGSIAGSVITSLDAVRNYLKLGFEPEIVAKMASTNPAALLGLTDRGAIEPGMRADLVAINDAGEVVMTIIGGRVVGA